MEALSNLEVRRLALARAGLLKPEWTGLPRRASGRGQRARAGAHAVIRRFGYLQLDTVPIAGARSHALVLLSRLGGLDPELPEELLRPGEPLFEYWGHEASWLPIELYPAFAFRRRAFRVHPWYGNVLQQHSALAEEIKRRIEDEGPLRSLDFDGSGSGGWWRHKPAKKVAGALWSCGELAIAERRNFHRFFDLAERVIPAEVAAQELDLDHTLQVLLLRALAGHGWARTGTLTSTWRLRNLGSQVTAALEALRERGEIVACRADSADGRELKGWVRPQDLELASRLRRVRPRPDRGVLLSPFDPLLWDRQRVRALFDFEQILEIFKPAPERVYGYYCLPVLVGDRLVARFDLKADRERGRLRVLARHFEPIAGPSTAEREAAEAALEAYAARLELQSSA